MHTDDFWQFDRAPTARAVVAGVELVPGRRVRLRPRPGADIFDLALAGKVAVVEAIEQDFDDNIQVAVTVEDDPGRDLGAAHQPGHRFFFGLDELEPLGGDERSESRQPVEQCILVAGIGNIFCGDDGFGVEVARRLARRRLPDGVQVTDFGIRGLDLAYALLDSYEAVIFVDVVQRGESPGTLYLIEPQVGQSEEVTLDTHGMDPARVLALARAMGAPPTRTFLVACEPGLLVDPANDADVVVELSGPVRAAVDEAVAMVESLVMDISGVTGGRRR